MQPKISASVVKATLATAALASFAFVSLYLYVDLEFESHHEQSFHDALAIVNADSIDTVVVNGRRVEDTYAAARTEFFLEDKASLREVVLFDKGRFVLNDPLVAGKLVQVSRAYIQNLSRLSGRRRIDLAVRVVGRADGAGTEVAGAACAPGVSNQPLRDADVGAFDYARPVTFEYFDGLKSVNLELSPGDALTNEKLAALRAFSVDQLFESIQRQSPGIDVGFRQISIELHCSDDPRLRSATIEVDASVDLWR